jgi:hypothetical protein
MVAALLLISAAHAETGVQLEAMAAGPWHHLPNPVGEFQFNRDIAKCRLIALQTPVSSDTAAVVGIVRNTAQINCMKALGYEPGTGPKPKPAPRNTLANLGAAGGGVGVSPCADFSKSLNRPEMEAMFFTWTEGYLTGFNIGLPANSDLHVDLATIPREEQMQFLRRWCSENPSKRYAEGATALLARLRQGK